MRTKTLVLAAAISAASLATSMAQVYSVNAVGYVNVTLKKGYNLISNPLNNGGNTLNEILPANTPLPEDTYVVAWDTTRGLTGGPGQQSFFFPDGGWDNDIVLPPGKGFFVYINPQTAPQNTYTITFVGEVPQGNLNNPISGGSRYNALSSQVPQAGKVSTDLGLVGMGDDILMVWDKNANPPGFGNNYYFLLDENNQPLGWSDLNVLVEPTIGVGDAFFLFRAAAGTSNWTRTFNVNTP